jgi:hypothetical protein
MMGVEMDAEFDLDGCVMHASQTAPNGAINAQTIFRFSQSGNVARAAYSGGRVRFGELIGLVNGAKFEFRYCQVDDQDRLDGGVSQCQLERRDDGGIRIIEHFFWESRGEAGTNVIEDCPDPELPAS